MDVCPTTAAARDAVAAFMRSRARTGKPAFSGNLAHRCQPGACTYYRHSAGFMDAVYVCTSSLHTHRCGRHCREGEPRGGMIVCAITGNELGSTEEVHVGRGNRDVVQHG